MTITRRNLARRPLSVRVLLLLFLLAAAPAAAQEGRIVGRVTDGTGSPVAGARVTLTPADAEQPSRTTQTGETGGFEFAGVRPGEYRLRVAGTGYGARELRVALEPGKLESVIARLAPARRGETLAEQRVGPRQRP